jgi:hypothetical protein
LELSLLTYRLDVDHIRYEDELLGDLPQHLPLQSTDLIARHSDAGELLIPHSEGGGWPTQRPEISG